MAESVLLLPLDPLNERAVDEAFARERDAARADDVRVSLVDHDQLSGSERVAVFRGLPDAGARVLYRGWMMSADAYGALESALVGRGFEVVTSAAQYAAAHHLPGWIDVFRDLTPATAFVPADASRDEIIAAAGQLGGSAFVVKDWVKSRKHEWDTAAFAPSIDQLPDVVAEFIRLQEEFLVGDVVIRQFVDLDKSRPEVRIWWAQGAVALVGPHPDFSGSTVPPIDAAFLELVARAVAELGSPFMTTDLALTASGDWLVIEVGDGQVSGFPESATELDIQSVLRAVFVP